MASKSTIRRNLFLTLGLLWLVAVIIIGVRTINAGEEVFERGPIDLSAAVECFDADPVQSEFTRRLCDLQSRPVKVSTTYDVAGAALQIGFVTLLAGALAIGVGIWTKQERPNTTIAASAASTVAQPSPTSPDRPRRDEPVMAQDEPSPTEPTKPPPMDHATEVPSADSSTRTDAQQRAEAVEALRQLKSLHDEGILTDAEYEAKRQPLADQL